MNDKMEVTFRCCRNKESTKLCCIQCFSLFHKSCMERKKTIQIIDGHKMICSRECATKKKNADDELKNLEKKIEALTKIIRETNAQLEDAEKGREELNEEIESLRKDNKDKDVYIHKIRRSSRDFQDEVAGIEENYIKELNEQKRVMAELKNDITALLQKNSSLQEELRTMTIELDRYQNDIADLNAINKNMITSFETLSQERDYYIREWKKMKMNCEDSLVQNSHNNSNTPIKNTQSTRKGKEKQTKNHQPEQNSGEPFKKTDKETFFCKESNMIASIRSKILFVSGFHGKGMINWLLQLTQCNVQSIRKPGASDEELAQTAIRIGRDFTKNDFIVLWLNKTNTKVLEIFIGRTQHTQVIILSEPYRYDININQIVYNNNINFHKKLHDMRLENTAFLDCNNVIRRSNYTYNGYKLKKVVGRYLTRDIMRMMNLMKVKNDKALENSESQKNNASTRVLASFLG